MRGRRMDGRGMQERNSGGVRLEEPLPFRARGYMDRQVDVPNYYQRDEVQVPRSYRREPFQRHYREDEEDGPPYRRENKGEEPSRTAVKLQVKEELTDNYRKRSRGRNGD